MLSSEYDKEVVLTRYLGESFVRFNLGFSLDF